VNRESQLNGGQFVAASDGSWPIFAGWSSQNLPLERKYSQID